MPQKALFSRLPLLDREQCPLSRGQVRTGSPKIKRLYQMIRECGTEPETLEAVFSLSVLVCESPEKEPAAKAIRTALFSWEKEDYPDNLKTEIAIARAALALYEYSTDKSILTVLALWCRKLETEWDEISQTRYIRIQPADLMEFFVRFYRITGLKAVLRLCARLRTTAIDWTTILQNEPGRRMPDDSNLGEKLTSILCSEPNETLDYDKIQVLSHHGEILADGMRYTAYSAEYSGHDIELKAGRNGWDHLKKNHHAVCGGLTADPFLKGGNTAAGNDPKASAAWLEAIIAQMHIHSEVWAADEATRLIHNALEALLNAKDPCQDQYVNMIHEPENEKKTVTERKEILTRICRAAALAYHYAFTVTKDAIRMNWQLPGRYLLSSGSQALLIQYDQNTLTIRLKEPAQIRLAIYHASTETAGIILTSAGSGRKAAEDIPAGLNGTGFYMILDRKWENGDTLRFVQGETVITEKAHHQGRCYFMRNRLLAWPVEGDNFRYVPAGVPEITGEEIRLPVRTCTAWAEKGGIPADIPVLPAAGKESGYLILSTYAETAARIAVFPGNSRHE